jgi:Holliday junction resolvasome RuvABC endonuclease subunit
MSTHLLAIDPGSSTGAIALFTDQAAPIVGDLAVVDNQVDAAYLARLIRDTKPKAVVVERVHSMPKQGVASSFRFGVAYGIIQGVVMGAGVPLHLVTPNEWKRGMRLIGTDKDAARALAIRLFPEVTGLHLKKHVGRADALLLGHYFMLENKPHRVAKTALWPAGQGDDYD